MSDPPSQALANHLLQCIQRDLDTLKDNQFLTTKLHSDIMALLPRRIEPDTTSQRPVLPARKSTNNTRATPATPPRQSTGAPNSHGWPLLSQPMMTPSPPHVAPPAPPAYEEIKSLKVVEALYDYQGEDSATDLSFSKGDTIHVTEYVNNDWWRGTLEKHGRHTSGIFPQNHVQVVSQAQTQRPIQQKGPAPPAPFESNMSRNSNTPPYSYPPPPPPTAMYQPPPPMSNAVAYPANAGGVYPQPPPGEPVAAQEPENNKVKNMAQKFGGHVATAATWGFGATLGSEAAHALF